MITFVLPWFGPESAGGAENQARGLTRALHAAGVAVRVWTSTGRDSFQPGAPGQPNGTAPYYPPGQSVVDGVPVWRFRPSPVGPTGLPDFLVRHPELCPDLSSFARHELALLGSLLGSDELYEAILAERHNEQNCFVFMPYPFPTTFWGTLLAPERSYLLACLHDEPYARYATYQHMFRQARGMLANSHPEALLAQQLYGLPAERIGVTGEGIDLSARGDAARFRRTYGLEQTPLLLYAGRRDESKNTPLLLAYIREYRARRGLPLRLVLMGAGPLQLTTAGYTSGLDEFLLDLGFLDAQSKQDAYAAADIFIQPSLHESFSIVLMEAWLQGRPAIVHADCAVTRDHAVRSGGGLACSGFGEFAAALDLLLANPGLGHTLGQRGRAYVLDTCDWSLVARLTHTFLQQT